MPRRKLWHFLWTQKGPKITYAAINKMRLLVLLCAVQKDSDNLLKWEY
jgi:hypothetical protein